MESDHLRRLFFQTGLPQAYTLSQEWKRREQSVDRGENYAANNPCHRLERDQL